MARIVAGLLLLIAAFAAPRAHAQDLQRIVAVVNDEVISLYDLSTRTRLNMASSGLEDSAAIRRQVQAQTLRALIDERLQAQEAQRLNLSVTQAEIDSSIARIEQQNRMQPVPRRETCTGPSKIVSSARAIACARTSPITVVRLACRTACA